MKPSTKAWTATAIFSLALAMGAAASWPFTAVVWPLFVYSLVRIINTHFSVKLFASIIKPTKLQWAIDSILAFFYITTPFIMDRPYEFMFANAIFFLLATLKYTFIIDSHENPQLVSRKILADASGLILAIAVTVGAGSGWPLTSAWVLTVLFLAGNIYYFFVNPLYRLDSAR